MPCSDLHGLVASAKLLHCWWWWQRGTSCSPHSIQGYHSWAPIEPTLGLGLSHTLKESRAGGLQGRGGWGTHPWECEHGGLLWGDVLACRWVKSWASAWVSGARCLQPSCIPCPTIKGLWAEGGLCPAHRVHCRVHTGVSASPTCLPGLQGLSCPNHLQKPHSVGPAKPAPKQGGSNTAPGPCSVVPS